MKHLMENGRKYLYTGIIILVITIFIHVSNGSVKDKLLEYVEMEPNFSIENVIDEESVVGLTYGDEILLYHNEVVIRGQIVFWMYITTAVLVVAGGAGIYIDNEDNKRRREERE